MPAARDALFASTRCWVRTERHPAVGDLRASGLEVESFDARYERGDSLDDVYRAIAESLIEAAAAHGEIAYGVPGNPAVAERTVELLHEADRAGRVSVRVVPGLSFADAAWARIGVDPMATGARVVDGRALDVATIDAGGPLLIAQCDHALTMGDVKVTLLERFDPATTVTVLQRLGLPDEQIVELVLADLDRAIEPDHLTAVYVPSASRSAPRELSQLLALAERLRAPDGCPWDAEQTHHSLSRYLLEESYEVVEAVERLPLAAPGDTAADDPAYVALVSVNPEVGTVTWPNGVDLDELVLYCAVRGIAVPTYDEKPKKRSPQAARAGASAPRAGSGVLRGTLGGAPSWHTTISGSVPDRERHGKERRPPAHTN